MIPGLRIAFCLLALFVGCSRLDGDGPLQNTTSSARAESSLSRACRFLWSRQESDGGWHSETYGLLRSGQALTPFILHSLLQVPEDVAPRPTGGVDRALQFIRTHVDDRGVLGVVDPDVLEYPNYSTAYALLCLVEAGDARDRKLIGKMARYLHDQQFAEPRGFDPDHVAHGGWGFGGEHPPGKTGHMDLAHTRRVLEALEGSGFPDAERSRRARIFLEMVQKHPSDPRPQPVGPGRDPAPRSAVPYDGGFYLSPVVLDANKGLGETDASGALVAMGSYASATCDGLLALLAAGVPREDERVRAARRWLERHPRIDYPEGVPVDHVNPWGDSILYYHVAVRSEALAALDETGSWREDVASWLDERQNPDGSWRNRESHLMKEDDPLLRTALGALALARAGRIGAP